MSGHIGHKYTELFRAQILSKWELNSTKTDMRILNEQQERKSAVNKSNCNRRRSFEL